MLAKFIAYVGTINPDTLTTVEYVCLNLIDCLVSSRLLLKWKSTGIFFFLNFFLVELLHACNCFFIDICLCNIWNYSSHLGCLLVAEFVYEVGPHSVVIAGTDYLYDECSMHQNLGVYRGGHEYLYFTEAGWYYFFCEALCYTGMKFYIYVN